MVDRNNRDRLIINIQNFMNDKINSFEFDENIFEVQTNSEDKTIKYVVDALWHYYDDIKDHKVTIYKEGWDFIQRLILILTSDKEIIEKKERKYTIRQVLSLVLFTIFILSYFYIGYSLQLLYISIGLGIFSMALSWWKEKSEINNLIKWELYPFSNIPELLTLKREQKSFQKQHYNQKLEQRNIRSDFIYIFLLIQSKLAWLVFSPFVLLYQSLPETNMTIVIKENK
jgi:hypothetical protein